MPRELLVTLHDIEPETFEHCALIREWLADLGVERVTLCVARPGTALGAWLRDRAAAGDAVMAEAGVPRWRLVRRDGALHVHVHPSDFDAHPWRTAALERLVRRAARRRGCLRADVGGVLRAR